MAIGTSVVAGRTIEHDRPARIKSLSLDTQLTETLSLRVGRQEPDYRSQRLVSRLDWVNDPRTFDGLKVIHQAQWWKSDAFFLHRVGDMHSGQTATKPIRKSTPTTLTLYTVLLQNSELISIASVSTADVSNTIHKPVGPVFKEKLESHLHLKVLTNLEAMVRV